MIIRNAVLSDIEGMSDLLKQLFEIETDFAIDHDKQCEGLKRLLESSDTTVLVAEACGKLIGMVTMQRIVSTATGGYAGLIEDVVVDREYRGDGVGKKLLDAIVKNGHFHGYMRIQMAVAAHNEAAIKFYEKSGFSRSNMLMLYKSL